MNEPYSAQYDPGQQPGYAQQGYSANQTYPQQAYGQQSAYNQVQSLAPDQLAQLIAPIALYPDSLIALMLAASTYPAQVSDADRWRQAQGNSTSDQIAGRASLQNWDPSVKALTAFPQVLAEMDGNLAWTAALGNAYYNQPQDVLQAIQIMRQRAQAAGSLQSTPQQLVNYDQGYIQIAPTNAQVVYVPAYNPWTVYGQPVSPYPGFSLLGTLGSFFNSSTVRFGLGMVMSAFSHTSWGWLGWGLNWLTQNVLFHQSNYYSNSTTVADWGLPHGGPRAFAGQRSIARVPGSYGQPGRGYNPTGFSRSQNAYSNNWSRESYNRGYQTPAFGNSRPPLQNWNRNSTAAIRPQTYSRPGYGYSSNNGYRAGYAARPGQSYGASSQAYDHNPAPMSRPQSYIRSSYGSNLYSSGAGYSGRTGQSYGNSFQNYRAPSAVIPRGDYGQHSSSAFRGNSFVNSAAKPQHSGGFHLFGGHSSDNFSSGHAPKNFNSGKSFGGGHSGGFHSSGGGHLSHSAHFGGHGGGGHHHL